MASVSTSLDGDIPLGDPTTCIRSDGVIHPVYPVRRARGRCSSGALDLSSTAMLESSSEAAATYVISPDNNGAITYVSPVVVRGFGFPFASVRNASGRYMQPTIGGAQAALTAARTDAPGGPVLDDVFTSPKWNAYPRAEYASAIVPTSVVAPFTIAKGDALGRFLTYAVCDGQAISAAYGNAPRHRVGRALGSGPERLRRRARNAVVPGR